MCTMISNHYTSATPYGTLSILHPYLVYTKNQYVNQFEITYHCDCETMSLMCIKYYNNVTFDEKIKKQK